MRSFMAQCRGHTFPGSYRACLAWAMARATEAPDTAVKIYTARAGERAGKVISEVSNGNVRLIENGRTARLKTLPEWK